MATAEDNAFMADLLGEVDVNIPSRGPLKTVKTESRRKTRVLSPPISTEMPLPLPRPGKHDENAHMLNTPPSENNHGNDYGNDFMGGMDDDAMPASDPVHSSPTANAAGRKGQHVIKVEEAEDDDMMEVAQAVGDHKIKTTSINISGSRPTPKVSKAPAYPSPASSSPTRPPVSDIDASSWNDVTSKLNVISSQETVAFGKLDIEGAVEQDGALHLFWTDYTEVNGSLCLFGKVKDKRSGGYASAFVKVDNILRKLYFLPRTYKQSELGISINLL